MPELNFWIKLQLSKVKKRSKKKPEVQGTLANFSFFLQQPQALSSTSPHIFFSFVLFSFLFFCWDAQRDHNMCVWGAVSRVYLCIQLYKCLYTCINVCIHMNMSSSQLKHFSCNLTLFRRLLSLKKIIFFLVLQGSYH